MKGYGLLASALALAFSGSLPTAAEAGVGARPMLRVTPAVRVAPPERRFDRSHAARFEYRFAPRREVHNQPQNQQQNQGSLDFGGDPIFAPTPTPTPTNEAEAAPNVIPLYPAFAPPPLEPSEPSSGPRIIEIGPQTSEVPTRDAPNIIYGSGPVISSGGPKIIYGDTTN
jgi:hypothetical protein